MKEPKVAQKSPYVLEVKAGVHAWCACGQSSKQPFCDGSHQGSEFNPVIEKVEKDKIVAWCGCKHSGNGAFCDGSHTKL